MKKHILFLAAAVSTLLAASCAKEAQTETVTPVGMKEVTITASIDQATKTSYDAAGKFSWTKGDQISVVGSDKKFHTLTATSAGATVVFRGEVPDDVFLGDIAFFPADEGHRCEEGEQYDSYYYNLPEYKDLSTAEAPSAGLPMASLASDGRYVFKHMCGAAMFTFTNVPSGVDAVEVAFSQALKFSGEFATYVVGDGVWKYFGAANATEGTPESRYVRKVKVVNNTATAYLPYPTDGQIWAGLQVNVAFYEGDKKCDLVNLSTKADMDIMPRATLTKIAEVRLPRKVAELDWNKVDWTKATTQTGSGSLTKLEYFADYNYLYVRLTGSVEKLKTEKSDKLDFFLYDRVDGTLGDGFYTNFANSTGDVEYEPSWVFNAGYVLPEQTVAGEKLSCVPVVKDDVVTWTLALPRRIDVLDVKSKVYIGFMTKVGWDLGSAIPSADNQLLEVTLP